MSIKKLDEFDNLNEGFLSSLFGGVSNLFKSKKSKIESLLKDIKKAKEEDTDHTVSIEKEIWNTPKEDTPEYRFQITNLNRQSRTYSSIKGQELNSLIKQADKIIEEDPKLRALFSAGLAKIEAENTEKLIKNLKPYKEKTYLDQLNAEFDSLVKDANRKIEFYKDYSERGDYYNPTVIGEKMPADLVSFIDMSTEESSAMLKSLDQDGIEKMYSKIKNLMYDLDIELNNSISAIRKDIKKARKDGQDWLIPTLEQEEMKLRYQTKKPIDKLRRKIMLVEKEIKSRRYVSY